jgi:hypothetical protein
VGGFDE